MYIIRPNRLQYDIKYLGPQLIHFEEIEVKHEDFELMSKRNKKL